MKETVLTSAILILAILAVRQLFQSRISRRLVYGIWLLVALRLLVPVQFGNFQFSVLNPVAPVERALTEISRNPVSGPSEEEVYSQIVQNYIRQDTSVFTPEVQEEIQNAVDSGAQTPEEIYDRITAEHPDQTLLTPQAQTMAETAVGAASAAPTVGDIAMIIWLTGAAFMAVWFLAVNLKHNKQIREVATPLPCEDSPIPVMISPLVDSPCLAGLFRPVIYLTPDCAADDDTRRHVLVHELTHYRNKDHIWAFVRCVCLCVYWFHPLVWVAALVSHRDCELACDEGALKHLGSEERIAYGKTLLRVVSQAASPTALLHTATSMNESKKQLTERVNYIAKKPKVWISAAVCTVLACAIATGCAFAGASAPVQTTEPIVSVESTAAPTEKAETEAAETAPTETVPTGLVPIKESFLPMGGSENFFYVPCDAVEAGTYRVYPLGENLLHFFEKDLTLIDTKTGDVAAQLQYESYITMQVIADYAVVFDGYSGMIDIFDASLAYVKSYPYPQIDNVTYICHLGADLETLYYFKGEYELESDIRALNLRTGEETVLLGNLPQLNLVYWETPGGYLFSYFDGATNTDKVAYMDLVSGEITEAPAEGMFNIGSAKSGDVWFLDHYYLDEPEYFDSNGYELYVGDRHVCLHGPETRFLESRKHLVRFVDNFDTMVLYDLDGNLLSSCNTSGTNTVFYSYGTFIWNESLNGYFIYGLSDYGNSRLYFWDLSIPVKDSPLGLA